MKKLLILSGKGGTGKTTLASAIIEFSKARAFADCDVDAPNLHLIHSFKGEGTQKDFVGSEKAVIDINSCTMCGICVSNCRFDAIEASGKCYRVNEYACEGCGVCELVCPHKSVALYKDIAGKTMLFKEDRTFSTARLKMGRGNSGKLVTEVKKELFSSISVNDTDLVVVDGSPGIGCPVIAASGGMDGILIVTEPTVSGISDVKRITKMLKSFNTKLFLCVNKADVSSENTKKIKELCKEENIMYTGEIPYDSKVIKAVNEGKSIACIQSAARDAVYSVYKNLLAGLENVE